MLAGAHGRRSPAHTVEGPETRAGPAKPLQVLIVEDSPADAALMVEYLTRAGFAVDWRRVDTETDLRKHLSPNLQLVLADHGVPRIDTRDVMRMVAELPTAPPVIIVTGAMDDEVAVQYLKAGAADYVLKDRMARLGAAAEHALRERDLQRQKERAERAAQAHEERINAILATVEDVLWSVDAEDGRLLFISPAAERLYGRTRQEFYDDPTLWMQVVHPEDLPVLDKATAELMKWGTAEYHHRIRRADGTIRFVQTRAWAAFGQDGRPTRFEGIVRDVTDHRMAREERESAERARLEAQKMKALHDQRTRLLSLVAHELNNPLTPMRVQTSLLLNQLGEGLSPQQRDAVRMLSRAVDRMKALLEDLLDVSRMDSGKLRLDLTSTDFSTIVEEEARAVAAVAEKAQLIFSAQVQSQLAIVGDPRRLRQVLANLLSNAIKFTPAGGSVRVQATGDAQSVQLRVIDTGRGIAADEMLRLFQPFSQLPGSEQLRHTGTGLGLYICKGIVEQHGGQIRCESQGHGKGTTFIVTLPRRGPLGRSEQPV